MYRLFVIILAAIAVANAPAARAQSVSGSLDVVDQQALLGWVCNTGDPSTYLDIELWAVDAATGGWLQITTTHADKGRIDIGRSGICGTGLDSNYHGFEAPVYPDHILKANASYTIYAYYRPTGQFLGGSARSVAFPQSGLPTSGWWRTDIEPDNRGPALMSCIWPFLGANSRTLGSTDPNWISAGPTWPGGLPPSAPLGYGTTPPNNTLCINYDVLAPLPSWAQTNSATNAPSWPTSNYWVVGANYEPAYSMLNSGPPNQSQPLNAGGVYSVSTGVDYLGARFFTLGIDNTKKPSPGGTLFDGIPFLSVGAQMGHGSDGPLAIVDPSGTETYLQFSVAKNIDAMPGRQYHFVGVFIEAMWGGKKRMVTVALQQQDTTRSRAHWSWNVYPSYYYPGAEINFVSLDDLVALCNINAGEKLDGLPGGGFTRSYSIPLRALFQCVEGGAVPNLGWTEARPAAPLFISGVHFALETPDGDVQNVMQMTMTGMQFVR